MNNTHLHPNPGADLSTKFAFVVSEFCTLCIYAQRFCSYLGRICRWQTLHANASEHGVQYAD